MKKKLYVFISILLLGGLVLSACSSISGNTLRGKVYYNNTDSMVYEAEVLLDGQVRDKTDYYGEFYITGLQEDSYTLRIRKKDAIEDYVEIVYPNINNNLIIKAEPVADTTIINGQVNISNLTKYAASNLSSSSVVKSASNIKRNNKEKFVKDEIIVKYDDSTITSASNAVNKVKGLNISKKLNRGNGDLVKFKIPAGKTVEEMMDYFELQPGIEYAEPNYYAYAQAIPNDSYYEEYLSGQVGQWGLISANLEAAWDKEKYSNSVTVAVIDSGIIPYHEDFSDNRLVNGANFVDGNIGDDPYNYEGTDDPTDKTPESEGGSHGTHVSGIIGALTNNNAGVSGVSWNVDIMPIKVLDDSNSGTTYDIAEGIYYAVDQGADILNFSLGTSEKPTHLEDAVEYADSRNKILVGASGNAGSNSVFYPAAFTEVIAVGSVDVNQEITSYSNYGPEVDLVAPGGDENYGIISTWGYYNGGFYNPGYEYKNGTSMSTAFVSGAAALLLESGVSPQNIRSRLISTAVDLGPEGRDNDYGYGLLDVYGALLNERIAAPYVFAASINNSQIIIESNSTKINSNGSYTLSDRIIGDYHMVAWRDINNNLEVDGGDYFGETDSPYFVTGQVYNNQDIDMYYVSSDSFAASLSVEGIEKLRD